MRLILIFLLLFSTSINASQKTRWFNDFSSRDSFENTCSKLLKVPAWDIEINGYGVLLSCDTQSLNNSLKVSFLRSNSKKLFNFDNYEFRFGEREVTLINRVKNEIIKLDNSFIIKVSSLQIESGLVDMELYFTMVDNITTNNDSSFEASSFPYRLQKIVLEANDVSNSLLKHFIEESIEHWQKAQDKHSNELISEFIPIRSNNELSGLVLSYGLVPLQVDHYRTFKEGSSIKAAKDSLQLEQWYIF